METEVDKVAATGGFFESIGTVQGRLLRLEMVVLLSAVLLAALVLYGSVHRRSGDKFLRGVMWMAYSLSYVVVSYAVGLIQDGPFRGETFVLWAAALLLIQASAYAAPAHSRRDIYQRKKMLLQHVLQTGLVLWLVVNAIGHNASYRATIWAFWGLNVLKTATKIAEMIRASIPDQSVKVVAEYMDFEEALAAGELPANPATMRGYRYLFHGEVTMLPLSHQGDRLALDDMRSQSSVKSVVTIDQVYRWIDRHEEYSEVEKDKAKDFCLAFTLFKLLKRRFYGHVPAEAGSAKAKAKELVLRGLIHEHGTGPAAAFAVVQAELAFLYDFFYTKNVVLVGPKTYIAMAAAVAGLTVWAAFVGTLGPAYRRPHVGVRDLDRSVTVVLVVITAALELGLAVAGYSNNWRYIEAVYRCVCDSQRWARRRRSHLWFKESITPPETRYWEDKVGQYELLRRYDHRPWNVLSWLTLYLVEPRRQGQKRGHRKELPLEVRRAVLVSLKNGDCRLTNGVATMERYGLSRLAWACRFRRVTDQILVWHVVTTRCDWDWERRPPRAGAGVGVDRLVATKLSKYCAYLVAFVPEMLPDPRYNAEQIFDTAVRQARDHLRGCRSWRHSEILAQLQQIETKEMRHLELVDTEGGGGVHGRAGSATVIERASLLGGQLKALVADGDMRWKVLAEFWAEFILFLAPSDNVDIHAEMLGAGGEFMTQLWALLAHAGVLERPPAAAS